LDSEKVAKEKIREIDVEDLKDDPELERLHSERLAQLQQEAEKRQEMQRKGHGEYQTIEEGDFLEAVTKTHLTVVHFFHLDFERCKIMDKHLAELCKKYFETRFVRISAQDAPFFSVKLKVKMLPCVILFVNGVAVDRVVGFDELGATDHWETAVLERRLLKAGVIKQRVRGADDSDSDEEPEQVRHSIRAGGQRDPDDESSDFSD